jgi:hypothetical protein
MDEEFRVSHDDAEGVTGDGSDASRQKRPCVRVRVFLKRLRGGVGFHDGLCSESNSRPSEHKQVALHMT